MMTPSVPKNRAQAIEIFGDIWSYVRPDGTLSPIFEQNHITRINLPEPTPYLGEDSGVVVSQITVNIRLVDVAKALYADIWEKGLWKYLGPYGGGFNFRPVAGTHNLSTHAWGIAWDWGPKQFPRFSKKKRNPELVKVFQKHGFKAGQDFHSGAEDPMHFQYATF